MKKVKIDSEVERKVLFALGTNGEFIYKFSKRYNRLISLYDNRLVREFVDFCVDFHKKYDAAPNGHIEDWCDSILKNKKFNDDDKESLHRVVLSVFESDYSPDDLEPTYLINSAERLVKRVQLANMTESVDTLIDQDDIEKAENLITDIKKSVEISKVPETDPYSDEMIDRIFESSSGPLLKLPGGLGVLLNPYLKRDNLIEILAPEKRGKSFQLMELANRALLNRLNVALFQVGDMTDTQMSSRMSSWLSNKPVLESGLKKYTTSVWDCEHNQHGLCKMNCTAKAHSVYGPDGEMLSIDEYPEDYEPCTECEGKLGSAYKPAVLPTHTEAKTLADKDKLKKLARRLKWWHQGRQLKLVTYPCKTVNVDDISAVLEQWKEDEGFVPDVLLIDYADILANEDNRKDERGNQNERWAKLRRLTQEYNLLGIVPSQAKRDTYTKDMVDMNDQSEDKRKNAHLTGMIGLHQTPEERKLGVIRAGWILLREGEYDEFKQALVIEDRNRGRAHVDSKLIYHKPKEPDNPKQKGKRKS